MGSKAKAWVATALLSGAFVAAIYAHWLLPKLLSFLTTNSTVIQTLGAAMQVLIWLGIASAAYMRLWLPRNKPPEPPPSRVVTQGAEDGGINAAGPLTIGGDAVGRDKITTIIQEAPPAAMGAAALHQLPPPPGDFTGRTEEIGELLAAVEKGGVNISGLQGLGGVGKTALALKLADQLFPRYPDAQFYLDLKGVNPAPLTAEDAMAYVIRGYHPDIKLPEGDAELGALYRSLLHNQKAILLMDNARDARQVQPLIPPPSCLLLVTSRQRFTVPGLAAKSVDALPPADARALLLRIAPRLAEDGSHSAELAELCGYLPLALRSVGSALAARIDLRAANYVLKLRDARERLKLTATEASLLLSYDLLASELQKRFRSLAVFPDTFDLAAASTVWDARKENAQEALGRLLAYSLVDFNPATNRYALHDLVRLFADTRLVPPEREVAQARHATYYHRDVLLVADQLYKRGGESLKNALALFDIEWGNIQAGQAWAAANARGNDAAASLCSSYPNAAAYFLELRQHPRERIRWLEAALATARQMKNLGAEGAHLGNLGNAYFFAGDYRRAIEYHEKHLRIAREIGDQWGEGAALGNLGIAYQSLGDYRRAIDYHEQDLKIARETGDRRGQGAALGNLGSTYHSLGEYRRGIEYHEQALAIARDIGYGRAEGGALGNLGNAYQSLGENRRAIEYQEQALVIARNIGDRQGEGNALGNLGNAYQSLGEHHRAIEYQEQALAIARNIGDRRGEGNALGNLGVAYHSLDENRRAIECQEEQLKIAREIGDRVGESNALFNMSLDFVKMGKRPEAIARAEAALRIYEQIESPDTEKVRTLLAAWREAEGGGSAPA